MAQWDKKGYKISSLKPCALDITIVVASGGVSKQLLEEKEQQAEQQQAI
jgi:hypothetical protein